MILSINNIIIFFQNNNNKPKKKMQTRSSKASERNESPSISEHLYLTKLNRSNINPLYTISNISLTKILSKINDNEINRVIRFFRFSSESQSKFSISFDFSKIKSTVIHFMLYLI